MSGDSTPIETEDNKPVALTKQKFNKGWTPEIEELMGEWADRAS